MRLALVLPVLTALAGIGAGWFLPNYLSPRRATQILTLAVVLTSAAVIAALAQLTLAGASELPFVADAIGWCRALYHGQHGASPAVGLLALVAGLVSISAMTRRWRRIRRERAEYAGVTGLQIVPTEGPIAFAVPGHPGAVVIGQQLLDHLDDDGQSAVLAHEHAHLRLHHHIYVHAADVCAAGLPMLRPLAARVRFMTERWADEVAVAQVGSRRVVAETIARVASLPGRGSEATLTFGGNQTVGRVEALLDPPSPSRATALPAATAILTVVVLGSVVQLHHLAAFFAHICPT